MGTRPRQRQADWRIRDRQRKHVPGSVGMAHSGDPKYADSQFYIVMQPRPGLDGKFTIFGRVTSGMDVVKKIEQVQTTTRSPHENVPVTPVIIESVTVVQ